MHDPYISFRLPDFRYLVGAWFLIGMTVKMQAVALGWDIYERTGSALAIGWVGAVQFAPALLFFLPAGQLTDRYDRRMLLIVSFAVSVLASLWLAWAALAEAPIEWLYAASFVGATGQALNKPARAALLPSVVPSAVLPNAVTWSSGAYQMASVTGPSLAGLLIASTHSAIAVYWSVVAVNLIALLFAARIDYHFKPGGESGLKLDYLLAGVVHVWKTPVILGAVSLDLLVLLFSGSTALLPIYAKDILQVGPSGLGWLAAAPAVGAIAMIFGLNYMRPSRRPGLLFLWAVAGFGIATIVFGWSTHFGLSLTALAFLGAMNAISVVTRQTVIQTYTPVELRGRVSSVNSVFTSSSNELGQFEAGTVASLTTPVFAIVSGGLATLVFVSAIARRFPALRRLDSLTHPEHS